MRTKERLAFMALGGFLVFVGQLLPGLMHRDAFSQGDKTVLSDTVVEGDLRVIGRVMVEADDGSTAQTEIGASSLSIIGGEGKGFAAMEVDDKGTSVYVMNSNGQGYAAISASDDAAEKGTGEGRVEAFSNSRHYTIMRAFDGGSVITAYNHPHTAQEKETGNMNAQAAMWVGKHGGKIDIKDHAGKVRAEMSITEQGDGTVGVWDKNGYKLK